MSRETNLHPALKQHIHTYSREHFSDSLVIGVVGGLCMLTFVAIIEAVTTDNNLGLKLLKYLILAIPMTIGLIKFKRQIQVPQDFFQKGLLYAVFVSGTAALLMAFADLLISPMTGLSLATISNELTNIDELNRSGMLVYFVESAMLFLEVFVLSMFTAFAILLFLHDYARTS